MVEESTIQDMETNVVDSYMEYTKIRGSVELSEITDKHALWQGICGEIKTPIGECQGVNMETYGCDIWKILGQNLTPLLVDQAKFYIKELAPKYKEVTNMEVTDITEYQQGKIKLTVYVESIFGVTEGDVVVG
jgi:hypothetical protein